MESGFHMHDLSGVSICLSIMIKWNQENDTIDISQVRYIPMILRMSSTKESRLVGIPVAIKSHKRYPDKEAWNQIMNKCKIEGLIYMTEGTHLGIASVIRVLSQFNHNTSIELTIDAVHICMYQNSTKDHKLDCWGICVVREGILRGERVLKWIV